MYSTRLIVSTSSLNNGFDNDGRPIIYMRPRRQNTETSPRQLWHLVFVRRAKDLMPPGQESLVIIVDYKTTALRINPPISAANKQFYVETLGRAIVTNQKPSSLAQLLLQRNFTHAFNPNLVELIPATQLATEFGGEYQFERMIMLTETHLFYRVCDIAPDDSCSELNGEGLGKVEPKEGAIKGETESFYERRRHGLIPSKSHDKPCNQN
ncbi:hypothetical protein D9757_008372 [Collybiopsis confluens]|uniref:CRAL-TRIO domain-containing protein n=1 Tax=Collybiopsis confluens TaxID=2823264 RepID=A0A8H5FUQ1_9AGAR|nr:hypothetical protein D9757_014599 [Collybiopsis confluens]KAF5381845.1 hypothetical protein D9757_008372 [Collybiopsis confluens]